MPKIDEVARGVLKRGGRGVREANWQLSRYYLLDLLADRSGKLYRCPFGDIESKS